MGDIITPNINEIFNEMILEDKKSNPSDSKSSKLKRLEKEFFNNSVVINNSLDVALGAAFKCQEKWQTETCLNRSMNLHKVSRHLVKNSEIYIKNQLFNESEFSLVVSYFNTFSDFAQNLENLPKWKPLGCVYLKLNEKNPLVFATATIVAAVAAGCCVIVRGSEDNSWFPLFLANVFIFEGLPSNLITVVGEGKDTLVDLEKVNKVIFYGSYIEAQDFYINCPSKSFRFFCPNNTSSIILESCDINAAVDKICSETWGANTSNIWGVSAVVVQEAIKNDFLEKLKTYINNFNNVKSSSIHQKDEVKLEKINKLLIEANKKGAEIIKKSDKEWGPIAVVNYQDQNVDLDVPVLKVMACRTPAEGVALLNNSRFCLGTSVWCENISQAMEVASKLNCKNIWLNCHGVVEAGVPVQPIGCSGNYAFNGKEGLMEFVTFDKADSHGGKFIVKETNLFQQVNVWTTISGAQSAFTKWRCEKNKRNYLIDLAFAIEKTKDFSNMSEIFKHHACSTNISESLANKDSEHFSIIYKKEPVGVIAVVINSPTADVNKIVSLITLVIASGNTIILVLENNNTDLLSVTNCFKSVLGKNILNVIFGLQAVTELASSSVVEAIWFYDESLSSEYLQKIRNEAAHNLKNIWMIPKEISKSEEIIRKQCTRSKLIWLTNIHQFP